MSYSEKEDVLKTYRTLGKKQVKFFKVYKSLKL